MPQRYELAKTIIARKELKISEEQFLADIEAIVSSSFQRIGRQDREKPLRQPDRPEE